MYYKVATSQLPAPRLLRVLKLYYKVAPLLSFLSFQLLAPRTKVVLQSRQFSSPSSADTPRTKVVLQSRQFSASSSTDAAPATKSAPRGSQSAAPATKSAHGGSQSAAPATKSAHGGSQSAVPATKSACACHEICTWRFTNALRLPQNLHLEVHTVLRLPRNLHIEVHKALCLSALQETTETSNHNGGTIPTMIRARSENDPSPRPSRTQRSAKLDLQASEPPFLLKNTAFRASAISRKCILYCACHEICTSRFTKRCACQELCHKVLCLPRNLHLEVHKVLRLPRELELELLKLELTGARALETRATWSYSY